MRLALLGRIGFVWTRGCLLVGRVLDQDIFLDGFEHESLKILDKSFSIFQPGWLVPEATEPTKATLTTEPVPLEMTIDYNGSPCFFSANLLQLVRNESCCLPEADKTDSKDAKDRDAVLAKKSKRSTDVDTDKNSTQTAWKKPEDKPGRIYVCRLAQCELADFDGHNHVKRVMARTGKLPGFSCWTHLCNLCVNTRWLAHVMQDRLGDPHGVG